MRTREEYVYDDVKDYLYGAVDLLIAGLPTIEDRSCFFRDEWFEKGKDVLLINQVENGKIHFSMYRKDHLNCQGNCDLLSGIPDVFRQQKVEQKTILIDLCSLDHVLIMYITKVLLKQVVPKSLFAGYIRPHSYIGEHGTIGFSLSETISGIKCVPGFAKREFEDQTLCSFIGFEGSRFKNVLESVSGIKRLVPVVAFPSGTPQWYNITLWNSMDVLQSVVPEATVLKCFSESIFEAIYLMRQWLPLDEKIVLVPLGTRPHSMACAIFACNHPHVRIIYDNPIEKENRSVGIAHVCIYHLSSFLGT